MSMIRTLSLSLISMIALFSGCGNSTPEIDNAERIEKEVPRPTDSPEVKSPNTGSVSDQPKG